MISRDAAVSMLAPIVQPTTEAFTAAVQAAAFARDAQSAIRSRMSPAVRGALEGMQFWSVFATELDERYERIGVLRAPDGHVLRHAWTLPGGTVVRLKSDETTVDCDEQLAMTFADVPSVAPPVVVLTYNHEGASERYAPAFVYRTASAGQVWRLGLEELRSSPTHAITPVVARAQVSSRRTAARQDERDAR
jgi:hypothetical protein